MIYDIKINQDSLKKEIVNALAKRSKALAKVEKSDSVRLKVITRWRVAKAHAIPHDTAHAYSNADSCKKIVLQLVSACDSVIAKDSCVISHLKEVIKLDSSIIGNYQKSSQIDSLTIVGLKKEVKKQKRQKRLLAALSVVLAGVSAVK